MHREEGAAAHPTISSNPIAHGFTLPSAASSAARAQNSAWTRMRSIQRELSGQSEASLSVNTDGRTHSQCDLDSMSPEEQRRALAEADRRVIDEEFQRYLAEPFIADDDNFDIVVYWQVSILLFESSNELVH